jgi:hypothetical protein
VGNASRASPELEWQCGSRATTMKRWRREDSVAAVFELRGRGKVKGVGAGRTAGGVSSFYTGRRAVAEAVARRNSWVQCD